MDERHRRTGPAALWSKYAGSIAFVTLIVVGIVGFARQEQTTADLERLAKRVAANQAELRAGLVRACEHSPIKRAVIDGIKDQIAQSRNADLEQFFPQIPPEQLHDLIHEAQVRRHQRLREIKSVDCAGRYR